MKILYDHQIFTIQYYGGISRYFCELMDQFSISPDIQFTLALRASYNENLCNRHSLDPYWSDRSFLLPYTQAIPYLHKTMHINLQNWLYDNQSESVRLLKRQDFDIFHPTYYDPYFLKYLERKPYVLTVHDMIHERYPEYYSRDDPTARWKKELIERADAIIAVSENTKKDLLTFFKVDPEKIATIYHGNPFEFPENSKKISIQSNLLSCKKPYLLYVGSRIRYKNFIFFITAIAGFLKKNKDLQVYCAGGGPFTADEQKKFHELGIQSRVHMVNTNNHIMPQLYAHALAFVFPSLYEGFGLPVLEAFSCSCPVIMSNTSSLPEIGGEAACYFDPLDPDSLANALESVIKNEQLRESYIKKGLVRLKEFSWIKTGRETKKIYDTVLNRF